MKYAFFFTNGCFDNGTVTSINENMTESRLAPLMSWGDAITFFLRQCRAKVTSSGLLKMLKTGFSSLNSASMALSRLTLKRNIPNNEVSGMFLHSTKLVKGTRQKILSRFFPLRGGGYPPFPLREGPRIVSFWDFLSQTMGRWGPKSQIS